MAIAKVVTCGIASLQFSNAIRIFDERVHILKQCVLNITRFRWALPTREDLLHFVLYFFRRVTDVDRISKTLRHLVLAINPKQPTNFANFRTRHWPNSPKFHVIGIVRIRRHAAVHLIEAPTNFARELQVRHLIFAHRYPHWSERQDVRTLPHRIQRESKGVCLAETLHLNLRLQRWVSHHPVEWQQHGKQECQFMDRGNLALQENRRPLRIDTHRQVVLDNGNRVAANVFRLISARGKGVVIGKNEVAVMGLLQFHAAFHASYPVAKVKLPSGGVASKNSRSFCGHGSGRIRPGMARIPQQ